MEPTVETVKTVAKVEMPVQNEIRRPMSDSNCGKLWAVMDSLSMEFGRPCAVSEVMVKTESQGFNPATTRTQYARWRKFNGIEGRIVSEKDALAKQAKIEAKATAKAEREAKAAEKAAEKAQKAKEREDVKEAKAKEKAKAKAKKEAELAAKAAAKAEKEQSSEK